MNSTQKLFLDKTYVLDGVTLTGAEIKEHIIDSRVYRKRLNKLRGDSEWDMMKFWLKMSTLTDFVVNNVISEMSVINYLPVWRKIEWNQLDSLSSTLTAEIIL